MRKKTIILLIVCFLIFSQAYSLDVSTKIKNVDMHPDFWAGIFPTDVSYMFLLNGITIIPDRITEIGVQLSTGISAHKISQDPMTGVPYRKNVEGISELDDVDYDIMGAAWSLLFSQGFGETKVNKKDLMTFTVSFDGEWERALNPILQLNNRVGYPFDNKVFKDNFDQLLQSDYKPLSGTPDLSGDRQLLAMSFNLAFEYNNFLIETADAKGTNIKSKFTWAPEKLCSVFQGKADFMKFSLYAEGGYTLFQSKDERGLNKFSFVVTNETELRILTGSRVPKYAQSMIGQIWNFDAPNTTFVLHDCLKLVYYGKQFFGGGFVPKVYLFLDMSYSGGKINNLDSDLIDPIDNLWTGSYGLHFELQIFEAVHVYYELGFVFLADGDTGDYQKGFRVSEPIKFMISVKL